MKKEIKRRIIAEITKEEQRARSEYADDYLYKEPITEDEDADEEDSCDDYCDDTCDKYNTIKVGPYEMQSIFSEKALRGDCKDFDDITHDDQHNMITRSEEYKRDKDKYNELVRKAYSDTEAASKLDSDSVNPLILELSSDNDEILWQGIINRFKATVLEFDNSTKPYYVKHSARQNLEFELITHHLNCLNESEQVYINPVAMQGEFNNNSVSYWAVHLIQYTRTVNGEDILFNYYEIYTKGWVHSVLCMKSDLERVVKGIADYHFHYSIVHNMIKLSQNYVRVEYARRSFSNEWYSKVTPAPVHTPLTVEEEHILISLPDSVREFTLNMVGYAALATIIPELSELSDAPKILAPAIVADTDSARPATKLIGQSFVYTGDGDIPEAYVFPLSKNEAVDTRGCDRRIIIIDTSACGEKLKVDDAFALAAPDYAEYIRERCRRVEYPYTWLPLCIGKQMWNDKDYLPMLCEDLHDTDVEDLKQIIRKLYRNAIVGIGEDGNPPLLEYVTEYYREADSIRKKELKNGSYQERMQDLIEGSWKYTVRDNPNLLMTKDEKEQEDFVDSIIEDFEEEFSAPPVPLSKTEMTDHILASINDMLASNSPDILREKPTSSEHAKELTFIYKTPDTFALAVCNDMLTRLISDNGYMSYTAEDFWDCCIKRKITQGSKKQKLLRASFSGKREGVMALKLEGEPDNCWLKLPTA